MIDINHRVTPSGDVIFTEVEGDDAVLLHLGTRKYFSLNETGVFIWRMMSNGHSLKEISTRLQDDYSISFEKASQSVLSIAGELLKNKLIEVVSA